jgi:hypothetical protein
MLASKPIRALVVEAIKTKKAPLQLAEEEEEEQ